MRTKNACMLLLTAFIWGTAFVAQSVGMDYLEPFTFNGVRCLIGAIALLPCIWFFKRGKEKENKVNDKNAKRDLIKGGIAAVFYCLQQAVCNKSGWYIQQLVRPDLSQLFILYLFRYLAFSFIKI